MVSPLKGGLREVRTGRIMRAMQTGSRIERGRWVFCVMPLAALVGCALGHSSHAEMPKGAPPQADWHGIATSGDRDRLRRWREAWTQALEQVAAAGESGELAAHPVLTTLDAALADPAPPPGDYRCRTFKLGTQFKGGLSYTGYPAFTCRIRRSADGLHFSKLGGSQRPSGLLYPDDGRRLIFLGTMVLGDETRPTHYGRDAERDMAGVFERTGRHSWRLVLPFPRWESTLDVIELTGR